jgi:hypothetical protein
MTTLRRDAAVSTREDRKHNPVLDYNRNKGGVDNLDKACYFLSYVLYFFYYQIVLSAPLNEMLFGEMLIDFEQY